MKAIWLSLFSLATACAPAPDAAGDDPLDQVAVGGKADSDIQILDGVLDMTLADLRLAPHMADADPDMVGLRIPVKAGQRFAIVMRTANGAFPALLRGRAPGDETVSARAQTILPDAAPDDAILMLEASEDGQAIVIATTEQPTRGGRFRLDIIAFDHSYVHYLAESSTPQRVVVADLRKRLPALTSCIMRGALREVGSLEVVATADASLADRVACQPVLAAVNASRNQLIDEIVRANGLDINPAYPAFRNTIAETWVDLAQRASLR